mmetsp:Transcript_59036/g.172841  ORF Transcript_59036/g.172841 Transcript_59036/m.172841 type:complete len:271 (-) Transcript_59036:507-1319(-)
MGEEAVRGDGDGQPLVAVRAQEGLAAGDLPDVAPGLGGGAVDVGLREVREVLRAAEAGQRLAEELQLAGPQAQRPEAGVRLQGQGLLRPQVPGVPAPRRQGGPQRPGRGARRAVARHEVDVGAGAAVPARVEAPGHDRRGVELDVRGQEAVDAGDEALDLVRTAVADDELRRDDVAYGAHPRVGAAHSGPVELLQVAEVAGYEGARLQQGQLQLGLDRWQELVWIVHALRLVCHLLEALVPSAIVSDYQCHGLLGSLLRAAGQFVPVKSL